MIYNNGGELSRWESELWGLRRIVPKIWDKLRRYGKRKRSPERSSPIYPALLHKETMDNWFSMSGLITMDLLFLLAICVFGIGVEIFKKNS